MQWLPREVNNDIDINGVFFFCPLTCDFSFYLQNLPSYLKWIGNYGPMYITCHEVVGIHCQDLGSKRRGRCLWIYMLDIMIQPFSKTHWNFNPLSLRWMVPKPKENIVGHKIKKPLFRWLACATFPLLISICSNFPTFLSIYKRCVNMCEVDVLGLGFRVSFRLGGYISWFYIDFSFLCCCNDYTWAYKVVIFCSISCRAPIVLGREFGQARDFSFCPFFSD